MALSILLAHSRVVVNSNRVGSFAQHVAVLWIDSFYLCGALVGHDSFDSSGAPVCLTRSSCMVHSSATTRSTQLVLTCGTARSGILALVSPLDSLRGTDALTVVRSPSKALSTLLTRSYNGALGYIDSFLHSGALRRY